MEAYAMNVETYLTQTIQNAVKEAVSGEFDDLKKALMNLGSLQSRSAQTKTSASQREIIRPKELA
jgi:hypothetical protein